MMETVWEYVRVALLAAVQGIAEFLPISSSGHLQVLGNWFGFDAESSQTMNIVLHAGTLLAIVVFYFRTLWELLAVASKRRVILLVILATVPTGIIGLVLDKFLKELLFESLWIPAVGFLITATLLLRASRAAKSPESGIATEQLSGGRAVLIGVVQGIAVTPGISRSGSTIAAGMKMGLSSAAAAEFSFLLAIPAIAGAALLEVLKVLKNDTLQTITGNGVCQLAIGFALAAIVGYGALSLLLTILKKGKLAGFAWYLYGAGIVVLAVECIRRFC